MTSTATQISAGAGMGRQPASFDPAITAARIVAAMHAARTARQAKP